MGQILSNLTYERTAPTTAVPEWTDLEVVDGALGGACLPATTKISVGSTTRNWNLQRRALEGPDFCVEELRTPFAVRAQLNAIMKVLTDYTIIEWEIRYRHEYLRLAGRKVVVGSTLTEGTGSGFPAVCPTGLLSQGVLNRYRPLLIRDGAAESALGKENNGPIFTIIISQETEDHLKFGDPEIRADLRYANPSALLTPYGVAGSYRGFYHLVDHFPIRGNCAGGVFTEVAAFDTEAATKGNKSKLRSAWLAASAEVSFIFDPEVFTSRIPEPITNPAPGFNFNPMNYVGDWKAMNILDRECNPDGTIIFHRGVLVSGSEPVSPERGVAFLHLRCDAALNLVTSCV